MPSANSETASRRKELTGRLPIAASLLFVSLAGSPVALAQTADRQLPNPTGKHAVGRITFFWKDEESDEPNTPDEHDRRELRADLWYPADVSAPTQPAAYFPDLKALHKALGPETLLLGAIKSHTLAAPPVAPGTNRFPVLVLSPGLGTNAVQYTYLVEELVSHGYLVATVDHPFQSKAIAFPDGRVVTQVETPRDADPQKNAENYRKVVDRRADDLRFVLDRLERLNDGKLFPRFKGRIDVSRVGVLGHSTGGITAARTCMNDSRFKAAVNLDGHTNSLPFLLDQQGRGPRQPFMELTDGMQPATDRQLAQWNMTREQFDHQRTQAIQRTDAAMRTVAGGSYRVTIPGVRHNSFGDMGIWDPDSLEVRYRRMQIMRDYVRAFFDKHLIARTDTLLDASQGPYPEVTLERFSTAP